MTIAERIKKKLDAGEDARLYDPAMGDPIKEDTRPDDEPVPGMVTITTASIKLTFPDGSQLQRVWHGSAVWVVV